MVDLNLCLSTKRSVSACCLPATLTSDILCHLKLTCEYLHFWLLTSAGWGRSGRHCITCSMMIFFTSSLSASMCFRPNCTWVWTTTDGPTLLASEDQRQWEICMTGAPSHKSCPQNAKLFGELPYALSNFCFFYPLSNFQVTQNSNLENKNKQTNKYDWSCNTKT